MTTQCLRVAGRKRGYVVSVGLIICATMFSAASASATDNCDGDQRLTGSLATHAVPCPTLCTEGTLTGDLAGKLEFTMTAMNPTSDPDVVTYEGTIMITTKRGVITGPDTGVWNLATGEFVDLMRFHGGTGRFEGKAGSLTIAGEFDPIASVGQSHYIGKLRTPAPM